ncbi:MAG: hypothetical protein EAX89_09060 [Candidatus Lokiarchaeota archaeon]|nr:hypothetical protein [Candidatus Lokiarchaeota archaeon]
MVYFEDKYLIKSTEIGKRINRNSYYFIASFIIGILLILFGIIFTTFILEGFLYILGYIMNISGFFLISGYIVHFSLITYENIDKEGVWKFE